MDTSGNLNHSPSVSATDAALDEHIADLDNPHQVTPAQLDLEIGVDVQAHSAILDATTASFLTAHATKLGHVSVTQAVDLDAIEARVIDLDAAVILKGAWDASAGTFPGAGVAQAGWSYIVSVAGTVDGVAFAVDDRAIAIVDNASTTVFATNWFKADYTDQVLSVAGKTGAVTLQVADITDMSANGRSLVSAANYAAMQTLLGNDLKAPLAAPSFTGLITAGGGQIAFPAVQAPSAGANVLDDYEELSFTPTITSSVGTITTSSGTVWYTKIGNLVAFVFAITITTVGTGAGELQFTLPFTAGAFPGALNGREVGATGVLVGGNVGASTAQATLVRYDGLTALASGALFWGSGLYRV